MRYGAKAVRRTTHPRVEGLEQRALLSDLSVSLTTDKPVYQPGDPIQFTFTETNISDHPVNIGEGPSIDGFLVSENGIQIWRSNSGAMPAFVMLLPLQPGQSFTLESTWNGSPNVVSSAMLAGGTYTVSNQEDPSTSVTFKIDSPLTYSLSVDKSEYHVGEPIQITFTETNPTDQPVSVNLNSSAFAITDYSNNTVWQSGTGSGSSKTETLQPGQSITQTATWDGISNSGTTTGTNPWGSFVVSSPDTPDGLTVEFWIDNPTSTELSVQNTSGAPDQPVLLTWTETNTSTVPITIPVSDGLFTVKDSMTGGQLFSATASATAPTVTIQPEQSFTQSVPWADLGELYSGYYRVEFQNGSLSNGTNFTLISPNQTPLLVPSPIAPPVPGLDGASSENAPPSSGPPVVATLETAKSTYQIGRRVALTFTLTNVSSQSIALSQLVNNGTFQIVTRLERHLALVQGEAGRAGRSSDRTRPEHRTQRYLDRKIRPRWIARHSSPASTSSRAPPAATPPRPPSGSSPRQLGDQPACAIDGLKRLDDSARIDRNGPRDSIIVAEVENERLNVAVEDQPDDLIVAIHDRAARVPADDVRRRNEVERRLEAEPAGRAARRASSWGADTEACPRDTWRERRPRPSVVNGGIVCAPSL